MKAYYAAFVPEGGKYSVLFPDVPGCATWGDSLEEAFEQALDALAGHLAALEMDNEPIPEASDYAAAWEKARTEYESYDLGPLPASTVVFAVPAPAKVDGHDGESVLFNDAALAMIDRKAAAVGMTRSGFLARAAEAYQVETA